MTDLVEKVALALLNDDRVAGGWPTVDSRERIADSHGYPRNARAIIPVVLKEVERHLSAVQYDPAPYTALKRRLTAMIEASQKG